MGSVFQALWAAITGILGAVSKFGLAAEHIGDAAVNLSLVAKETTEQYVDDAREQRKLNLRKLQAQRVREERVIEAEEQKLLTTTVEA